MRKSVFIILFCFALCFSVGKQALCFAQEENKEAGEDKKPPQGITVNGDIVEYGTTNRDVSASGNVEILFKGVRFTCDKITVNTQTKDGLAEGHVRIEDKGGVIEGDKMSYNFQTQSGNIIDAKFRSTPFFGTGRKLTRASEFEYVARRGYFSTCSLNKPHYRVKMAKVDFFPQNKMKAENVIVFLNKFPLICLPQYTHSFKDPMMHVQLTPGKSKDWGPYMLSAWRYDISPQLKGRVYLDYREQRGIAEGFGANLDNPYIGKGDFKFYYTQERLPRLDNIGKPRIFQRYLIRYRHQWQIDERTNLIGEYYKITDSKRAILGSNNDLLRDYFPREYEKSIQPPSYVEAHHMFNYAALDFIIQSRTNSWYDPGYIEKLPELTFSMPSIQMANTPFYFDNNTLAGNYNKLNISSSTPIENPLKSNVHFNRLDTNNRVSIPLKVAFVQLTPYASDRTTFYSDGLNGDVSPRTIFYSGADMSTKFFRIFNLQTDALGLDIKGLRHIITPTVGYAFNHEPTIASSKLRQIDGVDSISRNNSMSFEISNKLQTKRNGQSVDIADLRLNTTYAFKPKSGEKRGSSFSDFLIDLELIPYSWLRIDANAIYDHSGARDSENYGYFSEVNYDFSLNFGKERTVGIGQRYLRKGANELVYQFLWRINPKWRVGMLQRQQIGHDYTRKNGLREQEYSLQRDFHCWLVSLNYNVTKSKGETIWIVFTLKAFPELEFDFNRQYHQPKPGSQSPDMQI